MKASAVLLAAASVCACAAGEEPRGEERSSESSGSGGAGSGGGGGNDIGEGGLGVTGGGGPVCNSWQYEPYAPGPDGVLGTEDDVLSGQRSTQDVNDANVIVRSVSYASAGPDGAWDTADDVILNETLTLPGAAADEVYQVHYNAPGPDGVWGTDDGNVTAAYWAKTDPSGRPIDQRSLLGPGPDGQWITGDEPIDRRHVYSYGDGEAQPKLVDLESVSPGTDGVWGTADDPFAVGTRRFNEWGTFANAPGIDGVWGTDDDAAYKRYEDKRDWEGYKQHLSVFEPGPDTALFTPDDWQTTLAKSKCVDDAIDGRFFATSGDDLVWDTADDEVQMRVRITGCGNACAAEQPTSPIEPPK